MIPIGDSPHRWRTPWVNYSLIAICVVVFVYELSLGPRLDPFIAHWGLVPQRVDEVFVMSPGAALAVLLTVVTACFLHAGWLHLGGNMLFLWIFGDNVEDRLGHGAYLLFYLACGVVANLGQFVVDPTSSAPAIGASGAIAGVLGAYAITFPGARVSVLFPVLFLFWPIDVPALIMIGLWFLSQFFNGVAALTSVSAEAGGVAWWAHVTGFAVGILLMLLLPQRSAPIRPGDSRAGWRNEDTGLTGLAVGTVSLVSQLVQIAIGFRVVASYFGIRSLGTATYVLVDDLQLTRPLVQPFVAVIHPVTLLGRPLEMDGVVAILVYWVVGVAIIRLIDGLGGSRSRYRLEV